ncbi:25656_t:CDS:1, partial [Dentiscutata erythropus]
MEKIDEAKKQLDYVNSSLNTIDHNFTRDALSFKLWHGYMKIYQVEKSYNLAYEHYEKAILLIHTTYEKNIYYKLQLVEFNLDAFDTLVNYNEQKEGRQKLLEVINVVTKQFGERHNNVAKAYSKLGIFYLNQEEYKSAELNLLKAYDIYEQLPKIYIDYLITLKNLIKVCQHFNSGRKLVFVEKFYQHAEKIQPRLFPDALTYFLDSIENLVAIRPILLSQIDDILAKVANLNLSYPVKEIENLDYKTLKEMLKIREIEQRCCYVQIMAYYREIQFTETLSKLVSNYGFKTVKLSRLLKRGDTNRPNLIAMINDYSELINDGKLLLNEIHTQVVPKDELEIALLLNIDKVESTFDKEQYLRDALLKLSINDVSEEEFKQLLDISGQFTNIIDMAIAYIKITKSKIKEYCSFVSSCKGTFRISHPSLKNDACLNSFIIYCTNRATISTCLLNNIANTEDLGRELFYFIHLVGNKTSTTFFLFILIKHGLSEEHSNQILNALLNLKILKSENESIFISSFIRASLAYQFKGVEFSDIKTVRAFIEACSQYLKDRNIHDSESTLVIDIYRHTLHKFHDFIDVFNQSHEDIFFFMHHLYSLSNIYNDLKRSDQKILLELLLSLYNRFNFDKNTATYAEILTLLAFSERNSSNYHRHLVLIQEAHAIKSRLYKNDDPLFASSLLNLARAFGDIKNNEKQIELSKEGLNILEKDYNSNYNTLDADTRAKKEVEIINAFINLSAGYSRVNITHRIELLERCLNFYDSHHLNRPDVKERILSSLVNAYNCKNMPLKALEIYEQLEILHKQLYQEGTQEYARNVGYNFLNQGIAISKSSMTFTTDLDIADKMSEEKISRAREIVIKVRHAINKAIHLFANFYSKDDYIYSQACDALFHNERMENELTMMLKMFEAYRLFNNGNLDEAKLIYCEIFDLTLNQGVKSGALVHMADIDFIKMKESRVMSQQIRNNNFKQYNQAIEIHDSASVQVKVAMACFIDDNHEQAIIYAENSIQKLPENPITFYKMDIPILPVVLQMALMDRDEIKDIPIEFLAKYIIINSMISLGHIHSGMQKLKEFAILLSPNSAAISYLLLGFCYLKQGNLVNSLQAFDFVNQKDPDHKVGQIGFALTQLLIKIYKNIDASDMNIFKEIQTVNIILSSSDLTKQLFALVKSDSQIDIKSFVRTIN